VVDYAAALSAVLDVFDPEPLPADSPLWSTPNLVIMPHCSSDDRDQYIPLTFDLAFANLARLMAGKQLKNRVDPKRGY
jgi:phosphoglycerate dehydrogenase-like enzyme